MSTIEQTLWDEWVSFGSVPPVEDEISGIIDGLVCNCENGYHKFLCSRLYILRRLLKLYADSEYSALDKISGDNSEVIKIVHARQKGKTIFCIRNDIAELIIKRSRSIGRRARNWDWVRGVWGSCGSLYLPKTGYYMIIRLQNENMPERLQYILKATGFNIAIRKRAETREIIMRDQQQIVTFLSKIGFVQTPLALEEMAIYRSIRNHANKLVNCDSANINKTLTASQSQLQLIKEIDELGLYEQLPTPLRDLVDARKANPSISLRELGESLPTPISKSTVEYRWRKIEKLLNK